MKPKKIQCCNGLRFTEFDKAFNRQSNGGVNLGISIGCFKEPDVYTIVCPSSSEDIFPEYFDYDLDFEIYLTDESTAIQIYKSIENIVKNDDRIEECIVYGIFLNGENSIVICSDVDYCYGLELLYTSFVDIFPDTDIDFKGKHYLRFAHCTKKRIKKEFPKFFTKTQTFFV